MKKRLNLIVICADTWRSDYLGCNGNTWIKTPNLDRFAPESVNFTNVYADGLPTIPMRRVFFTGNSILPLEHTPEIRGSQPSGGAWRPLGQDEITITEILKEKGYRTGFITDCFHYFKPNLNFHRFFDTFEFIRGQERDYWRQLPHHLFDPKKHMPKHLWNPDYDQKMRQYMMNTAHWEKEEDYFCAQVCRSAMQWLEWNSQDTQPMFLWVDMFDPHEPWDAPRRFQEMYIDKIPYDRYLFGYGVNPKDCKPSDIPILKGLYAAEVTFTDQWIGKLLDKIRELGLMENSIVVFSTDHGTHIGEEGCVQKTHGLLNSAVARLPLLIHHPDPKYAGKRVNALVSGIDYAPTMLKALGVQGPKMDGQDMWPLVTGRKRKIHDRVFVAYEQHAAVRDLNWHYFQHVEGDDPGHGPALYDIRKDPGETKNVARKYPKVVAQMRKHLEERLGFALP
ncbi:MAG: sulfatase-like hydrolase/transferase [Planctomycetes bacterium]|nr:sulfatase-like hydrolase/transferase [Planctomycetota bacterium]